MNTIINSGIKMRTFFILGETGFGQGIVDAANYKFSYTLAQYRPLSACKKDVRNRKEQEALVATGRKRQASSAPMSKEQMTLIPTASLY
jgi:hypothetical protein